MVRKIRRRFTPEQKATIIRRHLVDKVAVSDLCDEYRIQPSMFYKWQSQIMENLAAAGGRFLFAWAMSHLLEYSGAIGFRIFIALDASGSFCPAHAEGRTILYLNHPRGFDSWRRWKYPARKKRDTMKLVGVDSPEARGAEDQTTSFLMESIIWATQRCIPRTE